VSRVAILGGGNGGFAAAAHHALVGNDVALYSRSRASLEPLNELGGIAYSGVLGDGFARVKLMTNDLGAAIEGADLIMLCVPATAHEDLARQLVPLANPTTPIILNPGATGGALALRRIFDEAGLGTLPVGETNTLTYITRKHDPRTVFISLVTKNVRLAVLPNRAGASIAHELQKAYPSLRLVSSVLETALTNSNAVLHPPGIILGASWIEHTGGDFRFYFDGATEGVARVMKALDEERIAVGGAWDIRLDPLPVLLAELGVSTAAAAATGSYLEMLRESEPNKFIRAPSSLQHRYFHEDIPFGLYPMRELGRARDVATFVMDALIGLASVITGTDLSAQGRSLTDMGLDKP
jgi:opine dehydrogenase